MLKTALTGLALAAILAPESHAQRFLLTQQQPAGARLLDATSGAIVDEAFFDLSFIDPPVEDPTDAQVVDSEVWISAAQGIYRFDLATQQYIDKIDTGTVGHFGMWRTGGWVWVAADPYLIKMRTNGSIKDYFDVIGAHDVMERGGALIVASEANGSVARYNLQGQVIGHIIPPGGLGDQGALNPTAIAHRPSTDTLLVVAGPRVFEFTYSGVQVGEYQEAIIEQGVAETGDGRVLISALGGLTLFDSLRGSVTIHADGVHFPAMLSPFDAGSGDFIRYCDGAVNSSGIGATLAAMGTTSLAAPDGSLAMAGQGLPASQTGLLVYAAGATQVPFGDGFLCVPLGTNGFRYPQAFASDASGIATIEVDYDLTSGAGQIQAGSSWNFQFLYRDPNSAGAGFNGSDAIGLTFRP